jgi:proteasome lid subunit RPN8/RPN11
MLRGFLTTACRWLQKWGQTLSRDDVPAPTLFAPAPPRTYRKVQRVVLTDEVSRTLVRDFANHRAGPRGEEEVGWVLLGVREENEVLVLATLPAGADREAGVAHVHFNSTAQAVACRFVRQQDRRLGMVGVVHTHPGSLRHPSNGDYQGDSRWVPRLRGGEGVYGIGTADGKSLNGKPVPHPEHMRTEGELCFSWYALGAGDKHYRRLPVAIVDGPDLAQPLHALWHTIEAHADAVDRLCMQLARVTFEVGENERALAARVPVGDSGDSLLILLHPSSVQFYLDRGGELTAVDPREPQLDRAVFLVLAELARQRRPEPRSLLLSKS